MEKPLVLQGVLKRESLDYNLISLIVGIINSTSIIYHAILYYTIL